MGRPLFLSGSSSTAGASRDKSTDDSTGERIPTPDQPLLDGESRHASLGENGRGSLESGSGTLHRRMSSSSSAETTEFERGWGQHQRGYQVLALACALLIS
ncbi:hypothetical protein GGH95_006927, partial [Coemansia sp. RSA 1836]